MSWFSFKKKEKVNPIEWQQITSVIELKEMIALSNDKVIAIFKHSTRCSISAMAKRRFERAWDYDSEKAIPVYLDLLNHRDVSNAIEDHLSVQHASPQLIVLKDEQVMAHTSHSSINAQAVEPFL
jgi:bacillithiol system protein YtxJ